MSSRFGDWKASGVDGTRRRNASGTTSSRPNETKRFIGERIVSDRGMPFAAYSATIESGRTAAAFAGVVICSGALPLKPPCHTSMPVYPAATSSG